jgi:hypothetical protein
MSLETLNREHILSPARVLLGAVNTVGRKCRYKRVVASVTVPRLEHVLPGTCSFDHVMIPDVCCRAFRRARGSRDRAGSF